MESFGIPCAHIFAVLIGTSVVSLPRTLLLQWSRGATSCRRPTIVLAGEADFPTTYRRRVGAFVHQGKRLAKVACLIEEHYKLCLDNVFRDTASLEAKLGMGNMSEMHPPNSEEGEGISVKDPARARTKGMTRVNDYSAQKGPKRRKCSNYGHLGHRRTRCPDRESHRQCEKADGVPSQAASQVNEPSPRCAQGSDAAQASWEGMVLRSRKRNHEDPAVSRMESLRGKVEPIEENQIWTLQ
ncbi:hypothetical protein PIB30_086297 [Stylosanthes scabra]|uniref:SWIM-type domain-containing protein n=1 Tax=Stylosanthes scabra TaxID=79078 RepID=A0ABU6VRJ1_9FABA|nr:hypothetical protein [Stylosanthes scabra]